MRILINNLYRPELDQHSFLLTQQASDPVPTCNFTLIDEISSIPIAGFQEVIVIDETAYPDPPTHNLLTNPTMNPYTSDWTTIPATGVTLSQQSGGGLVLTTSNKSPGWQGSLDAQVNAFNAAVPTSYIQPGVAYTFSVSMVGTTVNLNAQLSIQFYDFAGNNIGPPVYSGQVVPPPVTPVVMSVTATAPVGSVSAFVVLGSFATNSTNSGSIVYRAAQCEPNWYPTVGYPTAYCDDGTDNGYELPDGTFVREKRLFGGWITDYKFRPLAGGAVAEWRISCSGYGWLFDKRLNNTTFTNEGDDTIITGLITGYFAGRFTTNHVIAAPLTIPILQYGYDTLRKILDDICNLTNQRWTIDPYGDTWYVPQQYQQASYGLTDGISPSPAPDGVTLFAYSNYQYEGDFTQPTNDTKIKINTPAVNTTAPTTITSGSTVVTPASMLNILVNGLLTFSGGTGVTETVKVTAITSTTCTAVFSSGHSGAYSITNSNAANAIGMARVEQGQARAQIGCVLEKYIDDSQIVDQGTAHIRGVIENIQYAYERTLISLELDEQASQKDIAPGVSVQISSGTGPPGGTGFLARSFLIQKVAISILASGDTTLRTRYLYALDLGSYNPNLENLFIKNFAQATTTSIILPAPTAQWNMANETIGYNESVTHTP